MPNTIMYMDIMFPQTEPSTSFAEVDQEMKRILTYNAMLLKELQWSLYNLGEENFNENDWTAIFTPIYAKIEDTASGMETQLAITAEGLALQVADIADNVLQLAITTSSLASRIVDAEGNISLLQQTVSGFTLAVSNGSTSSVISLKSGNATVSSVTINMIGLVTFSSLSTPGATTIDAGNITTGTISANRINVNDLYVRRLYGQSNNSGYAYISGNNFYVYSERGTELLRVFEGSGWVGLYLYGSRVMLYDPITYSPVRLELEMDCSFSGTTRFLYNVSFGNSGRSITTYFYGTVNFSNATVVGI